MASAECDAWQAKRAEAKSKEDDARSKNEKRAAEESKQKREQARAQAMQQAQRLKEEQQLRRQQQTNSAVPPAPAALTLKQRQGVTPAGHCKFELIRKAHVKTRQHHPRRTRAA